MVDTHLLDVQVVIPSGSIDIWIMGAQFFGGGIVSISLGKVLVLFLVFMTGLDTYLYPKLQYLQHVC